QIGDENVHLVRSLLEEVFGSENYVSQIGFRKTSNLTSLYLSTSGDHILWFAKSYDSMKYRPLYTQKSFQTVSSDTFGCAEFMDGSWRRLSQSEKSLASSLPSDWKLFGLGDLTSSHFYDSPPFEYEG